MNRIIRRSATAIAAATLGFGALTTSFAGAASAASTGCPTSVCSPKSGHSNWIPGHNDPRNSIPGNNDPRNSIPGNNDPRLPRGVASA